MDERDTAAQELQEALEAHRLKRQQIPVAPPDAGQIQWTDEQGQEDSSETS